MFKKVWTPDMIREIILAANGREPLNSHYFSTTYPSIYAAAERIFGSWGAAVTASGLNYDSIRKYRSWSRTRVLTGIRNRYKNGESLSSQQVQKKANALYMAAVHYFKSWGEAIRLAGLNYTSIRVRRNMTPKQIRAEIRRLYRAGEDLAYSNMRKNHQYLLASGIKKLGGGSWAATRRACGIMDNYRLPKSKRSGQSKMVQPDLF